MRAHLALLLAVLTPVLARAAPAKPNVLVILADDLGYGDVQCYNPERSRIPTPNLDRLAAQGMRFTDGHSSSGVCSPSRYTLLTGRYHWRSRLQAGIVGLWERPLLAPDRLTIAGLAKARGYQTACIGKWHLGWDWPIEAHQRLLIGGKGGAGVITDEHRAAWREVFAKPIAGGPVTRGFDRYFGTDVPNWPPYCFIENDRTVGIPVEFLPAAKLGNNQASLPGPALADWPLEGILPALAARACAHVAEAAARPDPFLLYLPLTTPHTPLAVADEWKGRSGLDSPVADLIMQTDAVVGQVLDALEKSGEAGDTLVFFSSDNGFAAYTGAKHLEAEGHFPSGPLRNYKSSVFEGGHRVAFLVRWPAVVKPGSVCGQLVHHADLMATLADVLGTPLPANAGEDSFSLLPLLQGRDEPVRAHAVSCGSNGQPGFRLGSWKYIPPFTTGAQPQLYNLADDIGETRNLALTEPARVEDLARRLEDVIRAGRSTPGPDQPNDVKVQRFPTRAPAARARS